ncbi:unnamed protein product, partial [Nippostrongylus brasiliensis]|uniref:Vicilin-like seed storage protein At2g18540 n=1 Tax=Nippostrongylus brasiliensis TaxID=27835 RepID=A0A0N4YZ98_NIPBR
MTDQKNRIVKVKVDPCQSGWKMGKIAKEKNQVTTPQVLRDRLTNTVASKRRITLPSMQHKVGEHLTFTRINMKNRNSLAPRSNRLACKGHRKLPLHRLEKRAPQTQTLITLKDIHLYGHKSTCPHIVRRLFHNSELMQLNGRMTPFDYKDDVAPPPPPVTAVFSNPAQSFATLFASGGMWSELGAQANMMYSQAGYDPIAAERKRIEDEQRRILEEQAKMREYQEHLVRELQKQREEQEKQLMEQKLALIKHQEEIERRERELKESAEETKARLEMERLALAEKARQIEEERIAKIEEEVRKAEEKRAQELERKRQEEELERQRKAEKEELVRKQQEAERERRAKEAAEEAARTARAAAEAAAEKLRQQQAELQKKRV